MIEAPPSVDAELLAVCAVLRWFDPDLLAGLNIELNADRTGFFSGPHLLPSPDVPGASSLHENLRADALRRLRLERPLHEITLHTQAFEYFRARLPSAAPSAERALIETECLYHLDKLFFLLAPRQEWTVIAAHVAGVRSAAPQLPHHRHLLLLYEGVIAGSRHEFSEAIALLNDLLAVPDLDPLVRARALNASANVYFVQTHYDRALALYEQAATIAGETRNVAQQAIALINMGMIYNELERYDQALALTMQSLDMFRALGDQARESIALYEIGNSALRLGRWDVAEQHLAAAARLCELHGSQARLAYVAWGQGLLYHLIGNEAASEAAYLHALTIAQSAEFSNPTIANDVLWQLGFLYHTQDRAAEALAAYERAIALATELGRRHWLSLIQYQRGNLLKQIGRVDDAFAAYQAAIATIETLSGATEAEDIKIGLLGTTQQVYEAMVLLLMEQGRTAAAFDYIERARSRAFLDTLVRRSPELYASVDQPVVTLPELQAQLPPDALLVEYFTTGVLPRGEHLINKLPPGNERLHAHLTQPPHVFLFAVTRERFEARQIALDPNTLRPLPNDPGPGRRLLMRGKLITLLHEKLIAPVQHLLRDHATLFLIPHGPLHYVPFMALQSADGQYLLDRDGPAIAVAPSATILLRTCLGRGSSSAREFLALGYKDAGARELPCAEAEAQAVARVMHGAAWAGSEPKSDRLVAAGTRLRWLHVAGHAVYNPHDPLASELRLGADDALSARQIIGRLELDADLVTLSACTSGLSHVVPGDELLGLQRAFLYAGARAVLCTLWEATDVIALLVMERFYRDLRRGMPAAAALRDAQVAVREMTGREFAAVVDRWRADDPAYIPALGELAVITPEQLDQRIFVQPFFWAPFMLIGRP